MSVGKWIEGLTARTPLVRAARKALGLRLKRVSHHLERALAQPFKDVEDVHHLRVGIRRATAALQIFADCLPRKVRKQVRRRLRDLRQAAGQARDWDVFLAGLTDWQERAGGHSKKSLFLAGYAWGQRLTAQDALECEGRSLTSELKSVRRAVLKALRPPEKGATLIEWAGPTLRTALQKLHDAAAADLHDDDAHLHRVRIQGKRLRYAMEIFAGCFDTSFREVVYPAVEEMQEVLGRANDSRVAVGHLTDLREALRSGRATDWRTVQGEITGFLRYHQRRLSRERQEFMHWQKRWHAADMENQLLALLEGQDGC